MPRSTCSIRSTAGWPSSVRMRLSSTWVTASGGPNGSQPCETTTSTRSAPWSAIAKPPSCALQSFKTSVLPPGRGAALASPPTTRTPGAQRLKSPSTRSMSSEKGSPMSTTSSAPRAPGARRSNSASLPTGSAQVSCMRRNGFTSTPGSRAATTLRATPCSISSSRVTTPRALIGANLVAGGCGRSLSAGAAGAPGRRPRGRPPEFCTSGPAQDLARDLHAQDLARTLADLHELHVPVHAHHGHVAAVADAAVDLDGLVGHPVAHLAREQLGHGGFLRVLASRVAQHGGMVDEVARGLDLRAHVGDQELDALEVGDGL